MVSEATKQQAALILIESGRATVSEAAALRGVNRQNLHNVTRELEPRRRRQQHLELLWKEIIKRLGTA